MKQNFATTVDITSTYAGEHAAGYISASLYSSDTLDKGLITVHPNVKYKQVISKVDASSLVADASCEFTPGGSVVLTEVVLEPKQLQVNLELCKSDFINSWEALSLGYSSFNNIPANFNDYLIAKVAENVAEATEKSIWTGVGANNGEFAGLVADITAADDAITITGTTIDSTNVLATLQAVYEAIPEQLFGKQDLRFFVSQKVAKAYATALSTNVGGSYLNWLTVDGKPMNFQGIPMEVVSGLAGTDYVVAAQISNLHFGTGLMDDFNRVQIIDMQNITGSDTYRIIMKYSAGVKVGITKEVVMYIGG